ncbi:MAG: hypothetical protein ACE5DX_05470 [Candidatus Dojkabacteria bacterium]
MAGEPGVPKPDEQAEAAALEFYRIISKYVIKYRYTPKSFMTITAGGIVPYLDIVEAQEQDIKDARRVLDELAKKKKKEVREGKAKAKRVKASPVLGN